MELVLSLFILKIGELTSFIILITFSSIEEISLSNNNISLSVVHFPLQPFEIMNEK